jgi:hypothetical protein
VNNYNPIVLDAPPEIATAIGSICLAPDALETLEQSAHENNLKNLSLITTSEWLRFSSEVRQAFAARDHLVIKGLPVSAHGATLIIAARTVGSMFRTYRGGQIVKHFKMSPWTTELSHTTRDGEFHTDINTEAKPPAITAMQCLDPDPGAPRYGVSRVARLVDMLAFLEEHKDSEALYFLTQDTVTMLNDRQQSSWSGRVVEDGAIRYHPETLRAAARRLEHTTSALEDCISRVAQAAMAVSEPFILDRGDVLLFSNHRTLHYRGECSVLFNHFPTDFISRSVFVLHTNLEIKDS